ncbi:MAG TPA: DUF4147 domain-containing protein [Candidatus Acidoferrum sp.]|jgi:hydroxypyruvate reductase
MTELKRLARQIFQETLSAIDIPAVMQRKLWCEGCTLHCADAVVDLRAFAKIRVVAIGKAAHAMVDGFNSLLPEGIRVSGVVAAPTAPARPLAGLQYFACGHPLPTLESWQAAEAIVALLKKCGADTLVFFLLSGGGSSLVELPLDPAHTLEDIRNLYGHLVNCGAPIDEMNAVRKHFSAVKGGRLAALAGQATTITFAVTDVPAGKESALCSGPTIPDPTTIADVTRIITQYNLQDKLPQALRHSLENGKMPETPKPGDAAFANAQFFLLMGTDDLFHPAHHAAEAHGIITCCDNTTDEWPIERAAGYLLEQIDFLQRANPASRVALIADGEVSSPVTGSGVGGRNSAFVLSCVEKIAGRPMAVLSAGTDGIDGNSPAAGAVADGETLARAQAAKLDAQDFLRWSDAYTFFAQLDDAIVTGPTGNNLRDLRILVSSPR